MAREKSELTHNNKMIGVRLTNAQYEHWKIIGGATWLRQQLAMGLDIKRRYEQAAKTLPK